MMSLAKSGASLTPYLRATSQGIASPLAAAQVAPSSADTLKVPTLVAALNGSNLSQQVSQTVGVPQIRGGGLNGATQLRYAHTDIKVPDYQKYRRASTKDPKSTASKSADDRRAFSYFMSSFATGVAGAVAAKGFIHATVSMMAPSKDVLALAKVEVALGDIPEGKNATIKWRGKPLFVRHRSAAEVDRERSVNVGELRDPQHDTERVQKPEWLVLLGVCTHLGCVPIANAGEYGGYYCPCHGSHYDASGRIRKGPAPLNLEVPYYEFKDENTLIVG